jgi:S-methylmethionine-dependent homocysteine/selenocysteine methylase
MNSYALLPDRLERFGIEERLGDLIAAAGRAAVSARNGAEVAVAGSLGPLGWSYRPDLTFPEGEAAEVYARVAALQAPYADVFIVETASSFGQARGAALGALTTGRPVWVSVSVDDRDGTKLRSGEPVSGLAAAFADLDIAAFLINCSVPEAVGAGVPHLPADRPRGGYANGFHAIEAEYVVPGATVDALHHRHDLTPAAYAAHALGWAGSGATILGGCCEVGPAHIAVLRDALLARGDAITGVPA